jgi:hypothetical protein
MQEAYHHLIAYSLSHPSPQFIHQHCVDAYAAQTADEDTKPISLVFALAGLYLYCEKNYNGKQVQFAHMQMAKNKSSLPAFVLPRNRGKITANDVVRAAAGSERDGEIKNWCHSVWQSYVENHAQILALLKERNIIT